MEPRLIEQGEICSMQCCESYSNGVRKSSPKKAKYHVGVAVRNRIAGLRQANCSYSEIYKTLQAEEIPISLSAIKRTGQHLETGNVARKKGSGRPKASSCRNDHQLKCTVLKDRKRSLQQDCQQNSIPQKTLSSRKEPFQLQVLVSCFAVKMLWIRFSKQSHSKCALYSKYIWIQSTVYMWLQFWLPVVTADSFRIYIMHFRWILFKLFTCHSVDLDHGWARQAGSVSGFQNDFRS